MAKATWNIDVNGNPHEVKLEWGYWGGERKVFADGELVNESTRALQYESQHTVTVDG